MTFALYSLITAFIIVCFLLIMLILIQKGRGGGLASAFGGGGGGNTAFGSKTGDVLTWATSIVFGVFLLLAIGTDLLAERRHLARQTAPAAAAAAQSPGRTLPAQTLPPPPGGEPVLPLPQGAPVVPPTTQPK